MNKTVTTIGALAAVASAIAIPSIALGNARRTEGSLSALQAAEKPYVTLLSGANEVPVGDPDGSGGATVSIDVFDDTDAEVCFDLAYAGIDAPTLAHIHRAVAGVNGPVVVDLGAPGPTSHTGCVDVATALADEIVTDPARFYVNVHNGAFPAGAIRGQLADGPDAAGSAHFLDTPVRAYDSRIAPATKLIAENTRTVSLATGVDGADDVVIAVPPGATAAIVTLTATETDGPGFLSIFAAGAVQPATSTLNYTTPGLSIATTTQVAVDASGRIDVHAGAAGTHFIVDVIGYYY
jgi:CHRD domain